MLSTTQTVHDHTGSWECWLGLLKRILGIPLPVHKSPGTPHPAPSSGHLAFLGTPTFICSVYVTMGGAASVLPLLGHGDWLFHSPVMQATAQGDQIPVDLKQALEEGENVLAVELKTELIEVWNHGTLLHGKRILRTSAARDGDSLQLALLDSCIQTGLKP